MEFELDAMSQMHPVFGASKTKTQKLDQLKITVTKALDDEIAKIMILLKWRMDYLYLWAN